MNISGINLVKSPTKIKMKAFKLSAIFVVLSLAFNAMAQTTTPPSSNPPASSKSSAKEKNKDEKQEWLDQYNKMKPKLDELKSKLSEQEKNGEFAQNVNKLDQMATDFK